MTARRRLLAPASACAVAQFANIWVAVRFGSPFNIACGLLGGLALAWSIRALLSDEAALGRRL